MPRGLSTTQRSHHFVEGFEFQDRVHLTDPLSKVVKQYDPRGTKIRTD